MAEQDEKSRIYEDPDALKETISKFELWVKENRNKLAIGATAVVILIAGSIFWYMSSAEEVEASYNQLFTSEYSFSQDSLDLALEGDGGQTVNGFRSVAAKFEGTDAGNLSNFYAGATLMNQGALLVQVDSTKEDGKAAFREAINYLQKFEADDLLVQARAHCLIGDAYMELDEFENAVGAYTSAISYRPSRTFTPTYHMKLAIAYEKLDKYSDAVLQYDEIINKYPKSPHVPDAKKYRSMATGLAGQK